MHRREALFEASSCTDLSRARRDVVVRAVTHALLAGNGVRALAARAPYEHHEHHSVEAVVHDAAVPPLLNSPASHVCRTYTAALGNAAGMSHATRSAQPRE